MELAEIRRIIDETDELFLEMFLKRMECSEEVARIKMRDGTPVLNPAREEEIVRDVRERSGELADLSAKLYRTVLELSRERQVQLIDGDVRESECFRQIAQMRKDSTNIVLIGMPGCGKTTVGTILARMTGRQLIETDDIVEYEAGCSIPEIFEKEGEDGFRRRETEAVLRASGSRGAVIATGGGTVVRPENYIPLHESGIIYHLERKTSLLAIDGRPISLSMDPEEIYRIRRHMYLAFRDRTADNNAEPESAARQIWEDFVETVEKRRF